MSWISTSPGGVRIQVKVQPRASRNELTGIAEDYLRVRLTAPPVEGAANRQLQKFMGEILCCSPGNIQVVRGSTGRLKLLEITGLGESEAMKLVSQQLMGHNHPEREKSDGYH